MHRLQANTCGGQQAGTHVPEAVQPLLAPAPSQIVHSKLQQSGINGVIGERMTITFTTRVLRIRHGYLNQQRPDLRLE